MLKVFVYGTLKPGEAYYNDYCANYVIEVQPALAQGLLFDLPLGYPAMTPGNGQVWGVLLTFASGAVLSALDYLEGYAPQGPPGENEYCRQLQPVYSHEHHPLGLAWIYLMDEQLVQKLNGIHLPDGHWTGVGRPHPNIQRLPSRPVVPSLNGHG